jgi:hypothetical protein
MRFRPANISLINRRLYLPRLLLTLSSFEKKRPAHLDRSLHINFLYASIFLKPSGQSLTRYVGFFRDTQRGHISADTTTINRVSCIPPFSPQEARVLR